MKQLQVQVQSPMPKVPGQVRSGLSIGALARRANSRPETIRYYERIGLLPLPPRTSAGHRVYAPADVERLIFVRRCRDFRFSLEEIRGLLTLADQGAKACPKVRRLALTHAEKLRARIRTLTRIAHDLERSADQCGTGAAQGCAIIETWSASER